MICPGCRKREATVRTDQGPRCVECGADRIGLPVTAKQRMAACGVCREIIKEIPVRLENTNYHAVCLLKTLQKQGCPKCHSKEITERGCRCGWSFQKLVDQGHANAMAVATDDKLCARCLSFNTQVGMGLPFYPSEPEHATGVCSMCEDAICERHTTYAAKNNILGINPEVPICSGAYQSSCYGSLEDKVKCIGDRCPSDETSRHHKDYDPLVEHNQCKKCKKFYCTDFHGNGCPDCVGVPCDDCRTLTPQEELYAKDTYGNEMVCGDCLSAGACAYCGEQMSDDEEDSYQGYCESCSENGHGNVVKCVMCDEMTDAGSAKPVWEYGYNDEMDIFSEIPVERKEKKWVCEKCYAIWGEKWKAAIDADEADNRKPYWIEDQAPEEPTPDAPGQTRMF